MTLPEGVQLNPSSADGLQACSEQQIGYEGPAGCRSARRLVRRSRCASQAHPRSARKRRRSGRSHIRTPLLEHELQGAVYLATPLRRRSRQNPFDSLLALYIVAEDPFSGIRVKLAGEIELNQADGPGHDQLH